MTMKTKTTKTTKTTMTTTKPTTMTTKTKTTTMTTKTTIMIKMIKMMIKMMMIMMMMMMMRMMMMRTTRMTIVVVTIMVVTIIVVTMMNYFKSTDEQSAPLQQKSAKVHPHIAPQPRKHFHPQSGTKTSNRHSNCRQHIFRYRENFTPRNLRSNYKSAGEISCCGCLTFLIAKLWLLFLA